MSPRGPPEAVPLANLLLVAVFLGCLARIRAEAIEVHPSCATIGRSVYTLENVENRLAARASYSLSGTSRHSKASSFELYQRRLLETGAI